MNYKIHAGSNTELIQQRLFDHGYKVRSKLQGKIDAETIKEICEMIDLEVKQ